ncbi:hypothetical protein ABGB17_02685 [Sphaerisporangium sp. B11E5]|uniref:hypothetical protein n=1 Tax=Sphaerisporangium sp. B11E5 TaxID=3153563 RepID=UPI00325EE3EC
MQGIEKVSGLVYIQDASGRSAVIKSARTRLCDEEVNVAQSQDPSLPDNWELAHPSRAPRDETDQGTPALFSEHLPIGKSVTIQSAAMQYPGLGPVIDANSCWIVDGAGSWYLMPLDPDGRKWWVCNVQSGRLACSALTPLGDAAILIADFEITFGDSRGKWRLEDAGDGGFSIKDDQTFKYMFMMDLHSLGVYAMLTDDNSSQATTWFFYADGVYDAPVVRNLKAAGTHPDYGAPPEQTSLNPPPERTDEIIIGEALIPAACVNDGDHSMQWKLQHSPFYVLRRSSAWKSQFHGYDGFTETTHTVYWDEGMTESVSRTLEWHINASIGYTGGFNVKALSAQITANLEGGLSVSTTKTWEESYFKHEEYETTYPSNDGREYVIADWERVDIYRLYRVPDGCTELDDVVNSWEFTLPHSQIAKSYQAPKPRE